MSSIDIWTSSDLQVFDAVQLRRRPPITCVGNITLSRRCCASGVSGDGQSHSGAAILRHVSNTVSGQPIDGTSTRICAPEGRNLGLEKKCLPYRKSRLRVSEISGCDFRRWVLLARLPEMQAEGKIESRLLAPEDCEEQVEGPHDCQGATKARLEGSAGLGTRAR